MVRMPVEMIAEIDKLRRAAEDLPSRPEMIRRLVAEQLKLSTKL
ncbi:ribbon-helix-helix protein, CopG family [Roseovarius nanhaiticus]|nr:ribbon-helix-helix protein, CopG family [Roseovarius nanhaiticus]